MWAIAVSVIMAALTGIYMLPSERSVMAMQDHSAREMAESMGIYRQAVIQYFSTHNGSNSKAPLGLLKNKGMIPSWSTLHTKSSSVIWENYRNSDGVIYIYPTTMPSVNITSELMKLSQNSLNVRLYRASDDSLYSPVDGTSLTNASLATLSIPDNAPVWMAARN